MADQAKRKVLDMVEQGQISPDEGLRLINALDGSNPENSPESVSVQGEVAFDPQDEDTPYSHSIPEEEIIRMKRLKRLWVLPFAVGLVITLMGAIWMFSGYQANGFGWGFWLAWIPFLIGIGFVAVSFPTSKGVWLHVRVKQKPGESPQRINISLPVPLRLVNWGFSTFGDKIPGFGEQKAGDFSEILKNLSPEEPFYVHVEDEDGEDVEIFVG